MAKITVNELQEIGENGRKIKEMSNSFRDAVSEANQKFEVKYKGNEGNVIEAFINKLNTIQSQVFEIYPGYLESFGSVLDNYDTLLSGLGFVDVAWSDDEGAQNVQNKLVGDQKEKIESIQKNLDSYFATAAEILGSGKISAETTYQQAASSLDEAGKNRLHINGNMQDFYRMFVEGLQNSQVELEAILAVLNHARYIGLLEPSAVVNAIADKRLTNPDDLKMLDAIQDSGDAAMVTAILSDKPFQELGKVDATNVSETMMPYAYAKFAEVKDIGSAENLKNLQSFIDELKKQHPDKVKIYMEKLSAASAQQGYLLVTEGVSLFPAFPGERTPEALAAYIAALRENNDEYASISEDLKKNAYLSGLFESLYVLDIGTKKPLGEAKMEIGLTNLKLGGQGFKYDVQTQVTEIRTGRVIEEKSSIVSVAQYMDAESIDFDKISKDISKLEASKKEAVTDFVTELGKAGVSFLPGGTVINVAIDVFRNVAKNSDSKHVSSYIDSLSDLEEYVPEKDGKNYRTKAAATANIFKASFELYEQLEDIREEIKGKEGEQFNKLFNIGGYSVKKGDDKEIVKAEYVPAFDLDSFLAMKDIRENGLSGYIYRQALVDGLCPDQALEQLNVFEQGVSKSDDLSRTAKDYALGRTNSPITGAFGPKHVEAKKLWDTYNELGDSEIIPKNFNPDKGNNKFETGSGIRDEVRDQFDKIAQGEFTW